jgi:hypothetical protein
MIKAELINGIQDGLTRDVHEDTKMIKIPHVPSPMRWEWCEYLEEYVMVFDTHVYKRRVGTNKFDFLHTTQLG